MSGRFGFEALPVLFPAAAGTVRALAAVEDGTVLLVGTDDELVVFRLLGWPVFAVKRLATVPVTAPVREVRAAPVLSALVGGRVQRLNWNDDDERLSCEAVLPPHDVDAYAFRGSGRAATCAVAARRRLYVYSAGGECLHELFVPTAVGALHWLDDNRLLVGFSTEYTLITVDTGDVFFLLKVDGGRPCCCALTGSTVFLSTGAVGYVVEPRPVQEGGKPVRVVAKVRLTPSRSLPRPRAAAYCALTDRLVVTYQFEALVLAVTGRADEPEEEKEPEHVFLKGEGPLCASVRDAGAVVAVGYANYVYAITAVPCALQSADDAFARAVAAAVRTDEVPEVVRAHMDDVLASRDHPLAQMVEQFVRDGGKSPAAVKAFVTRLLVTVLSRFTVLMTHKDVAYDSLRAAVDAAVHPRCYDRVMAVFEERFGSERKELLRARQGAQALTLEALGSSVPSAAGVFAASVRALEALGEKRSPLAKLEQLTVFHRTVSAEAQTANEAIELSADELLPIFIYVVSRAHLWLDPLADIHYCLAFLEHDQLLGSFGYVCTSLEIAVRHLLAMGGGGGGGEAPCAAPEAIAVKTEAVTGTNQMRDVHVIDDYYVQQ